MSYVPDTFCRVHEAADADVLDRTANTAAFRESNDCDLVQRGLKATEQPAGSTGQICSLLARQHLPGHLHTAARSSGEVLSPVELAGLANDMDAQAFLIHSGLKYLGIRAGHPICFLKTCKRHAHAFVCFGFQVAMYRKL